MKAAWVELADGAHPAPAPAPPRFAGAYLGSASTKAKARKLDEVVEGFDNDAYRLLVKPVFSQAYQVLLL